MARRAAVLTVSDRVSAGARADASGDAAVEVLRGRGLEVVRSAVPDDLERIKTSLRDLVEEGFELVVTTGGTGLAPRDVTPEATKQIIERDAPGLPELMRAAGRVKTPYAALSRGVAGIAGRTLVINLPGSTSAVRESLEAVTPLLDHALDVLAGSGEH